MAAGIFLGLKDLMILEGKDFKQSAWRRYQAIKDALGKPKHAKLTIDEYCRYYCIDKETVLNALKLN